MLRHTHFMNSMRIMSGQQVGNSFYPQYCFNKALEIVADLKLTAEKKQYSGLELRRLCAIFF